MDKIAIYFIPGLAAGPEIFENLNLSKDKYNINYRMEGTISIRRVNN